MSSGCVSGSGWPKMWRLDRRGELGYFTDSHGTYSVRALYDLAESGQPEDLEIATLGRSTTEEVIGSDEFVERARRADISKPILVVEYPDGERWVADGMHRLWMAEEAGAHTIRGYVVLSRETWRARVAMRVVQYALPIAG